MDFRLTLKWKRTNKTKKSKETEIERFDWFIERIQTRGAFGWLSERSGEQKLMPEDFLEINRSLALKSYCNTIDWPIELSLFRNKESMFSSFHPLADKTNNEHLTKPLFNVIRKSLFYYFVVRMFLLLDFLPWKKFLFRESSFSQSVLYLFLECLRAI